MKKDVSNEITFANGRANPFGWSTRDMIHNGRKIGVLYCGYPKDIIDGYSFEEKKEDENTTRLIVYWDDAF